MATPTTIQSTESLSKLDHFRLYFEATPLPKRR